jgi:hypothetical protein
MTADIKEKAKAAALKAAVLRLNPYNKGKAAGSKKTQRPAATTAAATARG